MSIWRRSSSERGGVVGESAAFYALLAAAFCAGVSMPLSRACLMAALVLAVVDGVRGRVRWRVSSSALGWLAYVLVAVVVTAIVAATLPEGALIAPKKGLGKTTKLLWYMGALLLPLYVTTRERFRRIVEAFALGCGAYAVCLVVLHPPAAWFIAHFSNPVGRVWRPAAGTFPARLVSLVDALGLTKSLQDICRESCAKGSFNKALAYLSGMGAGQRLMAGALAALSLCGGRGEGRRRVWRIPAGLLLALVFAGLLVTLKRGSLFAFAVVGGMAAARRVGWKRTLLAVVLAASVIWVVPASRERLRQIPDELRLEKGGRVLLWTNLAPAVRRQHPWGVGFRGLTYESLRYATNQGWRLEKRQNHMHCNPLQVLVEFGWIGLAVYLAWMALAFREASRTARVPWPGGGLVRAAPLLLLSGLFLNGFVEYNLADAEVTLIYGLAMGLGASRLDAEEASPSPDGDVNGSSQP